ncbi:MAG: tyrosine-type recombinase/integrase [Bacteroidota bacterium]
MIESFETYLVTEKRMSDHTVKAYLRDVGQFLAFVNVEDASAISEVDYQLVRGWVVALMDENLGSRSVNRKLSALRTFFLWLLHNGKIEVNPMTRIKGPKQRKRLPEFVKHDSLDEEKLDALFADDYSGKRDRLIIEVLYQTGIRLSELIGLKRDALMNNALRVLGKRNKERMIPVTPPLYEELIELLNDPLHGNDPHIFVTDKGKPLYPKYVYRKVNACLSSLTHLEKRSPHVLRHTFATHMLNNGAGLESLKELLGHANLNATQIYTHNSFDQLSAIYKQAHPRGED